MIITTKRPDAVIIGTIMPRGDAFHLHQWMKQSCDFNELPIMVIDAPPEKRLLKGWRVDEGKRLEAEDYVSKPVDPIALVPRVCSLLGRRSATNSRKIKVLLADDHALVRDGIRALLAQQIDIQVVGEAVDGSEAVYKTLQLAPDVVIMDISMPHMDGIEAARQICASSTARVLVLTQYDDEEHLRISNQAGVAGFIPKRAASSLLLSGIRLAYEGRHFIHPISAN